MEGLVLDSVHLTFRASRQRTTPVLNGVSLQVTPGETVALQGASGCGKSTLLRVIAGLEPYDSGSVTWRGVDMKNVPPHRRGFGLVFQDGQLFVHKTVSENIEYGLVIQKMPRNERRERVRELLELVGLKGLENRAVTQLSGGQRQRVALARSLAPSPELLLLDEPLSALDQELRERLALDLRKILDSTNTTAVFVTHDRAEANLVAHRVLHMEAGKTIEAGAA